jgi:hypothetical protein
MRTKYLPFALLLFLFACFAESQEDVSSQVSYSNANNVFVSGGGTTTMEFFFQK